MQVPKRRSEQYRRSDTGSVYLTAEGVRQLHEKLAVLQRGLPALIAEVMRTKENGDLSENFEYQDAKHTLRRTHGNVASIKARIARAIIIKKDAHPSGIVAIGSTVVVETSEKRTTYEILGSHESDPSHGRISDRSPLGTLLLGHSAGDTVTLTTKTGSRAYRILEVR